MTDLTQLSDEDLAALAAKDLTKVSDAGLQHLAAQQALQTKAIVPQPDRSQMEHTTGSSQDKPAYQPATMSAGQIAGALPYGAAKGLADLVQGPAQMILHGASALAGNGPVSNALREKTRQFDKYLSEQERQYQAETPGSILAGAGRLVGSAAPFIAGGGVSAGAQSPMWINALKAAGTGAASSALSPVNDVQSGGSGGDNFATQKGLQIGSGALAGAAMAPVMGGIARVIKPNTSPDVLALLKENVPLTPGQILGGSAKANEEKLSSAPIVGEMIRDAQKRAISGVNTAAYNRAMSPVGENAPEVVGREGVEAVKDALSAKYNALLPKLKFQADPQFTQEFSNINTAASSLPAPQQAQFDAIVKNIFVNKLDKNGGMTGESLKGVESDLTRLAKGYAGDPAFDNRNLGGVIGDLLTSVRSTLQRSNPTYADELSDINKGYANYALIRKAAGSIGAENGVFTPAQLQSAVKAADKSAGKGRFATGNALMQDLSDPAKNVIGSQYPDSGTAGRSALILALTHPAQTAKVAITGGALALPYTQTGGKIAAAMLAKRPEFASPLAEFTRGTAGVIGGQISPDLAEYIKQLRK